MEFESMFKTEQDCIDYIESFRWKQGFVCPICDSIRYWKKSKGRYECIDCCAESTVTNGTIFHKSTKPLLILFHAIWWMVAQKNGVSAKGLQKILGLGSYQTAWTWLHKFRRLMILNGRNKLQGTVEVDEVFLGGKVSGKRGRGAEGKSIIAVAVEINGRKTGRMRLAKIPKATSEALSGFIENNNELPRRKRTGYQPQKTKTICAASGRGINPKEIKKSSKIISDAWTGYKGLDKLGYEHEIQNFSVKDGDEEILPNVHRIASLLKRWLLGTHQSYLNKNKLEYYLDEFVFRYNRRTSTSRGLLFMRLIEQAVITAPVSYKEIINQNHG